MDKHYSDEVHRGQLYICACAFTIIIIEEPRANRPVTTTVNIKTKSTVWLVIYS